MNKHLVWASLITTVASFAATSSAYAQSSAAPASPASSAPYVDHDTMECERVPKEEMRPQMELRSKLIAEGWRVRQIKNYQGCYEVYGFDEKGRPVEAFFDPRTLARIPVAP